MIARMRKRIQSGFTLIELMIVVAIIGILAAVAIPAFMKYIRKSKTTEGVQGIKKIYEGARAYFMEETVDSDGQPVERQFPWANAAGYVPGIDQCCGQPGDKCPPDPSLWDDEPWHGLKFGGSEDPFYFSYDYNTNGLTEGDADATALASADLDCDGNGSVFSMHLEVDDTTKDIQGAAGIHKENELE